MDQIQTGGSPEYTSARFTAAERPDEEWFKASDATERRRIHNKIAHRNYRKGFNERMVDLETSSDDDVKVPSKNKSSKAKMEEKKDAETPTEPLHSSSPATYDYSLPRVENVDHQYSLSRLASSLGFSTSPSLNGYSYEGAEDEVFSEASERPHELEEHELDEYGRKVPTTKHRHSPTTSGSAITGAAVGAAAATLRVAARGKVSSGRADHGQPASISSYKGISNIPAFNGGAPHSTFPRGFQISHHNLLVHNALKSQIEYYFSETNLPKDPFLREHMDSQGFVPLSIIANLTRVRAMSQENLQHVQEACIDSEELEFVLGDGENELLRRREGWDKYVLPEANRREFARNPGPASFESRSAVDNYHAFLSEAQGRMDDRAPLPGSKPTSYIPKEQTPTTQGGGNMLGKRLPGEDSVELQQIQGRSQQNSQHLPKQSDHGEVPPDEHSDISDDNISLRSFTESVFDIGSVISSVSSSHSNSHVLVASFVDILILDPNMDRLLATTTSEFGVSPGRFARNFSRILKSYSRHLRQAIERSNLTKNVRDKYLISAKAVCNARHQISNLIASRYNEKAPTGPDLQQSHAGLISRRLNQPVKIDTDDQSLDEESSEDDEVDFMITDLDLKEFLVSGEPFRLLKRNLRSLVISDEFLQHVHNSVLGFIDLALADGRLRSVAHGLRLALTSGRDIESDLNTQIRVMASDLRKECRNTLQVNAATFLATYSGYISAIAIDQINNTMTSHVRRAQGSEALHGSQLNKSASDAGNMAPKVYDTSEELPHEQVLENVVAGTLPSIIYVDLVPHWTFLARSTAFSSFADSLRGLAYPTAFSQAKKCLATTIRMAEAREDEQLALEGQRLLPILAEMESCLQKSDTPILFSMNPPVNRMTALNRAKSAIEASTAAEWDWWPLQPPDRSEYRDRAELSWKCSCGTQRHITTLPSYAGTLQSIFDTFPLRPRGDEGPAGRRTSSLSTASSQGAMSTQSGGSLSTNASAGQSASSSLSTTSSAITAPDDGDDSVVDFRRGPRRYIYVFLLVKASEYTLDTIDLSTKKARDFFLELRARYNMRRGLWRQLFSVFVYNHCDFIKIIKPEPYTFMPGELKFELPLDHDDEYHYRPRPTSSALVTRHMFWHYFYGCYESDNLSHRLHNCIPLAPKCRIRNPAAEILEFFPKRDRDVAVAAQSETVEVCYGIVARECRSFFRVVVYLCLIIAPALWFVFAWLFVWGDRRDLQDATVPMTLVLATLSILWAVVYSGSDVRKDYSDGLN